MRTVIPFTRAAVRQETLDAVPGAELHDVSGSDDAYWALLADLWRSGETVLIVEHDIVPARADLDLMAVCGQSWCVGPYECESARVTRALGFARFDGALMRALPDLLDDVGRMAYDPAFPPRHWKRLDVRLAYALAGWGQRPHEHPDVTHLHDYGRPDASA